MRFLDLFAGIGGFPDWAFDRAKAAGISDTQIYKQAGNSVTVPVIEWIGRRMQ